MRFLLELLCSSLLAGLIPKDRFDVLLERKAWKFAEFRVFVPQSVQVLVL